MQEYVLVIALILIFSVIGLIITFYKREIKIFVRDADTSNEIPCTIHFYTKTSIFEYVADEAKPVIKLRRGHYPVRIESLGYKTKEDIINTNVNPVVIHLEREKRALVPLPIFGINAWNNLNVAPGVNNNEFVVNSGGELADAAGFFTTGLNILRKRTLVLFFYNTAESKFSENRLLKLEYSNGALIRPSNTPLISGEYIYAKDTPQDAGIEFVIPNDFAGRLNFVFYKADIKDLLISAFFK